MSEWMIFVSVIIGLIVAGIVAIMYLSYAYNKLKMLTELQNKELELKMKETKDKVNKDEKRKNNDEEEYGTEYI